MKQTRQTSFIVGSRKSDGIMMNSLFLFTTFGRVATSRTSKRDEVWLTILVKQQQQQQQQQTRCVFI
jgi:hypothetical protein